MKRQDQLNLVSYLAPNMFWFYQTVGAYLERFFNIKLNIVESQYEPLTDPALLQDKLDIAFICGLPFIQYYRNFPEQIQALVAPVMQAQRYQNRPVYFSDIIVNAESNYQTFADLANQTFSYNDRGSNSGYNLMRYRLLQGGYSPNFFNKVIAAGSHQNSIKLVAEGIADCAAIDSIVLEQELQDFPAYSQRLRIIESLGPFPIPPIIVSQRLDSVFINSLQSALLQPDTELQLAMAKAGIKRYVPVKSEDYISLGNIYDNTLKAGYEIIGNTLKIN